ncbi:unnamed protein product [Camellia sinensis]
MGYWRFCGYPFGKNDLRQQRSRHSPRKFEKKIGKAKPRKFQHVSIMGDECIDVRKEEEDEFSVKPIRRSFSMDSASDPNVYLAVQEIIRQNRCCNEVRQSEESSSRVRRQFFPFGHGRGSRSANVSEREEDIISEEEQRDEKVIERAYKKLALDALVIQQVRLAEQKTVNKDELLQMVRFGAEMVFCSKDSTITDEDIDRIIAKGEEATAELDAKMKKFAEDAIKFKIDDSMWIDIEIYLLNIFLLYAFATEAKCNLSGFSQLLIYMILMMERMTTN